ncbi:MAG TPA: aminotransferase class I/II-fold pyridoxal phosphate-dependent enzyme, partial [Candidatus Angelobacter sp.]|nr:aminotransferase class I/II-fold pyridoxal phosphate-dependent enzyme [Candidatus Angelobacter sp.]
MPLSLSRRAARTVQSEIRAMSIACEKVQGINLAQGVCDTEVPLPVRQGAKQAMDQGINSYTRAEGLAPIRQAIAEKMQRFNGVACDPETEVVVSSGATGAFYAAC